MPTQKRRPRRRISQQPGGQLGLIKPILKIVAPLIASEIAKFGIQKGLKKLTGKGMRGNGLLLAGQRGRGRGRGARRRGMAARPCRKPVRGARRRRRPPMRTLPFLLPPGLKL